ncbi:hypothetical protein CJ199_13395, partial [Brevibacterium paucivorans]
TDSPSYLPRYIDLELDELTGASAIAIDGPKAVGKSETATRRANRTYFLDRDSERELLRADMDALLVAEDTLCIDEWQHLPQVWDAVRRNVDKQVTTRYLLTGSATPKQGVDTHSGAGRRVTLPKSPKIRLWVTATSSANCGCWIRYRHGSPTPPHSKSSLPPRSIRYLIPALRPLCSVLRRTYLPPASPARGSCLASSS